MSWSVQKIGKPEKVAAALDAYSEVLSGQSKQEYDEALPALKDRVKQVFDGLTPDGVPMSDYRASMIARTEVAEAQTTGTLAGFKATGLKLRKKWFLAGGACEFCLAAAETFNEANAIPCLL